MSLLIASVQAAHSAVDSAVLQAAAGAKGPYTGKLGSLEAQEYDDEAPNGAEQQIAATLDPLSLAYYGTKPPKTAASALSSGDNTRGEERGTRRFLETLDCLAAVAVTAGVPCAVGIRSSSSVVSLQARTSRGSGIVQPTVGYPAVLAVHSKREIQNDIARLPAVELLREAVDISIRNIRELIAEGEQNQGAREAYHYQVAPYVSLALKIAVNSNAILSFEILRRSQQLRDWEKTWSQIQQSTIKSWYWWLSSVPRRAIGAAIWIVDQPKNSYNEFMMLVKEVLPQKIEYAKTEVKSAITQRRLPFGRDISELAVSLSKDYILKSFKVVLKSCGTALLWIGSAFGFTTNYSEQSGTILPLPISYIFKRELRMNCTELASLRDFYSICLGSLQNVRNPAHQFYPRSSKAALTTSILQTPENLDTVLSATIDPLFAVVLENILAPVSQSTKDARRDSEIFKTHRSTTDQKNETLYTVTLFHLERLSTVVRGVELMLKEKPQKKWIEALPFWPTDVLHLGVSTVKTHFGSSFLKSSAMNATNVSKKAPGVKKVQNSGNNSVNEQVETKNINRQTPWQLAQSYRPPGRFEQTWLISAILLFGVFRVGKDVSLQDIRNWIQEAKVTVIDFFNMWIVKPLDGIYRTVRHKESLALMSTESLKSDLDSLERMVVDFAKDIGIKDAQQLAMIQEQTSKGGMDVVMTRFEQEIKSPIQSALTGHLIRTLLIQIQKAKVDGELAVSAMDKLLRSNELNFAILAMIPSLWSVGFVYRLCKGTTTGLFGGVSIDETTKKLKQIAKRQLTRIERLQVSLWKLQRKRNDGLTSPISEGNNDIEGTDENERNIVISRQLGEYTRSADILVRVVSRIIALDSLNSGITGVTNETTPVDNNGGDSQDVATNNNKSNRIFLGGQSEETLAGGLLERSELEPVTGDSVELDLSLRRADRWWRLV